MKSIKLLTIIVGVLFVFGCSSNVQIKYNYSILDNPEKAKEIIHQIILEQPRGSAPSSVDINDDFIQITTNATRKSMLAGGVAMVPVTETLFFNNIKSAELYSGRKYYFVLVKENSDEIKLRILTGKEEKGRLFIDAIKTLERNYYNRNHSK